ncbi:mitochondrial transcription rescue factor 1 [Anopheles merus]|uniref:mitochondrial transcription rescue factor 1 n=1 Tax=Anopheles merus TaxID=30066 RepID=UPI001BE44740|nr:mitochondrial transcription rescue factor 1 [Anopheles merus]
MSFILRPRRFLGPDTFALVRAGLCAVRAGPVQPAISPNQQQLHCWTPLNRRTVPLLLSTALHNQHHQPARAKSGKRSGKQQPAATDDLDEEAEDELAGREDEYEELLGDKHTRTVRVTVNSMRADLLLKAGLGIARNKVEALFYDSKIRVNGKRLLKKSAQLEVEDEIDVVRGPSPTNPDHLVVSRVEIVAVTPRTENLSVTLRRHKSLVIENYKEHGSYGEGQDR